jgi:hypothetical protein
MALVNVITPIRSKSVRVTSESLMKSLHTTLNFCLYKPMSLGYHRTSPDSHSVDTLLLCLTTIWNSESHRNLCMSLFLQCISPASSLEFQFLSVRRTKSTSFPSATLSYRTNISWDTTYYIPGVPQRGSRAACKYCVSLLRLVQDTFINVRVLRITYFVWLI